MTVEYFEHIKKEEGKLELTGMGYGPFLL